MTSAPRMRVRGRDSAPLHGLSARVDGLSYRRRELIRPVLESPREFVLLSTRALARKLHVDPATAVRLVRDLGFGGYREFQHYLHELAIAQATSLDTMGTSRARGSGLACHVRETLDADLRHLQRLRHSLPIERVAALARRLHAARRILLIGGDLAASLVGFLRYHLLILGLPVLAAIAGGEVAALARAAGQGDVLIAISYRRCLRQTVEGLQQARANGAYCIGITDTFVSPIARLAHESFLTSVDTPSYGASYVAPMCLLNGIAAACGYYPLARTRRLLKKLSEEQQHGFRWYSE